MFYGNLFTGLSWAQQHSMYDVETYINIKKHINITIVTPLMWCTVKWLSKVIISEWVINLLSLMAFLRHQGLCKLCNHNLFIGIIIFPHPDNIQPAGHISL